jgi:hypothetical protein
VNLRISFYLYSPSVRGLPCFFSIFNYNPSLFFNLSVVLAIPCRQVTKNQVSGIRCSSLPAGMSSI